MRHQSPDRDVTRMRRRSCTETVSQALVIRIDVNCYFCTICTVFIIEYFQQASCRVIGCFPLYLLLTLKTIKIVAFIIQYSLSMCFVHTHKTDIKYFTLLVKQYISSCTQIKCRAGTSGEHRAVPPPPVGLVVVAVFK